MATKILLNPSELEEMANELQGAYSAIQQLRPTDSSETTYEHPAYEASRRVYGVMLDLLNILDLNERHSNQYTFDWSFMSPVSAAKLTGLAESWWRNKCAANNIPGAFKIGKQWIIPVEAVIAEAEKRGREIQRGTPTIFLVKTEESSSVVTLGDEDEEKIGNDF